MSNHDIVDFWVEKNERGVVISKCLCSCGEVMNDHSVEIYTHLNK